MITRLLQRRLWYLCQVLACFVFSLQISTSSAQEFPFTPDADEVISRPPANPSVSLSPEDFEAHPGIASLAAGYVAEGSRGVYEVSYVLEDGTEVTKDTFFAGLAYTNQNAGLFSVLIDRKKFSDALELTDEQVREIWRLRNSYLEEVRNQIGKKSVKPDDVPTILAKHSGEVQDKLLEVLLPHQREALLTAIFQKLGLPGTVFYRQIIAGESSNAGSEQSDIAKLAKKNLDTINDSVMKLKLETIRAFREELDMDEVSRIEDALGKSLEEYAKAIPLETLVRQLEFVANGGVFPGKTVSELVNEARQRAEDR
jgi:hypothetical protein